MAAKATKTSTVIKLLSRKSGTTIAQIQDATGWKPHSVRAAITGLRKKGHGVQRGANAKGVSVYKIVAQ